VFGNYEALGQEASLHLWDQHRFGAIDLSPEPVR
jgi:hypothetical protein